MLGSNQRPRDSGLCSFRCSLDYAFTVGREAFRWAPSSLYTFPSRGLARHCLVPPKQPSGFTEFDAIHTGAFASRCTNLHESPALTN